MISLVLGNSPRNHCKRQLGPVSSFLKRRIENNAYAKFLAVKKVILYGTSATGEFGEIATLETKRERSQN